MAHLKLSRKLLGIRFGSKAIYTFAIMFGAAIVFSLIPAQGSTYMVSRVIDGDTLVLESGERVRLLGIDTPEKGQKYYTEARNYLKQKVLGRQVRLEYTNEEKDKYGRLLRYVFVGGDMVNIELIEAGFASAYIFVPDKYSESLLAAEEHAREIGINIWPAGTNELCIGINWLQSNARGNDNENLNGEFITFRNKCTYPSNMSGWRLQEVGGKSYVFGKFILGGKNSVTLHTGRGDDNETDIYWGLERAVWNNYGDQAVMWDSEGRIALNYSY